MTPENIQSTATRTPVQLNDELFHYAASLLALLAESGAAVGLWWVFGWTNVLRGRMREVSLLPSSLRLDLLLSAFGSCFCSSSDWQSALSQAILLACVGQAFTNTLFSCTFKYKHGDITTPILYVHMHTCAFHAYAASKYPRINAHLLYTKRFCDKIMFEIIFCNTTMHALQCKLHAAILHHEPPKQFHNLSDIWRALKERHSYHLSFNFGLAGQIEQILLAVQTFESYMMPIKIKKLHTVSYFTFFKAIKEKCF